jgi:phosphoribosylformimino-5-aminoimidazole carboxamide ribotide isomerase
LGADVKEENIMINGWQQSANINILNYISTYINKGINSIFCTDISKDGLLQGTSIDLYKKILTAFPQLNLIASGGVASIEDVEELNAIGCSGVIIGKALYEGKIQLTELKKFLQ